ncbi:hypothetical protein HHI36_015584, partial [Cryptolaemus montrouzieri]
LTDEGYWTTLMKVNLKYLNICQMGHSNSSVVFSKSRNSTCLVFTKGVRLLLTKYDVHRSHSSVDLFKQAGERGLLILEESSKKPVGESKKHFLSATSTLIRAICTIDNRFSPLCLTENKPPHQHTVLPLKWSENERPDRYMVDTLNTPGGQPGIRVCMQKPMADL